MYKSILVPIDLSHGEKGKEMIEVARNLADEGARIMLVNVAEEIPKFIAADLPAGIVAEARDEAANMLKAMAASAGLRADTQVRTGTPRNAILEAAEDFGADLIVIGSHKPGMQDYLLGSTASRVVRHAKCSVLVAR